MKVVESWGHDDEAFSPPPPKVFITKAETKDEEMLR